MVNLFLLLYQSKQSKDKGTLKFSLNGTDGNSEFSESSKSLKHELKDPASPLCLAGTMVNFWFLTQEAADSSPFIDKYF